MALKVLTPVDGSPASLRAVDFAHEMLSREPGGSLLLLTCRKPVTLTHSGSRRWRHRTGFKTWRQKHRSTR